MLARRKCRLVLLSLLLFPNTPTDYFSMFFPPNDFYPNVLLSCVPDKFLFLFQGFCLLLRGAISSPSRLHPFSQEPLAFTSHLRSQTSVHISVSLQVMDYKQAGPHLISVPPVLGT